MSKSSAMLMAFALYMRLY